MIGSGLKKLVNENGMKAAKGVAYGSLRGYAATLSEGSGYKRIVLTTKFPDPEKKKNNLLDKLSGRNIQRELRVRSLTFSPNEIEIVFNDTVGTMKKIREFIDWFWPLLDEAGATKWDVCTECGTSVTGGTWKLIDGVAYYLHQSCAEKVLRDIGEEELSRKEADSGNYLTGTIGAFLGAGVGSILWAVVLYMGYLASIVGLAIGFLAEKGYNLLKGKQGKAKVFILILAIIFGVLAGNFLSDVITLAGMISGGELPGFGYVDIPALIVVLLLGEPEYMRGTISNIVVGLLFAALGVFSLLKKAGREVSGAKVVDLE